MEKIEISYFRFQNDCKELANIIKQNKGDRIYQVIYPVPSGGVSIAYELSKLLEIPIEMNFKTLEGVKKEKVLIVDDLIDSGKTLEKFPGYDTAVLYWKNNNYEKVTYAYGGYDNVWIVFPWEKEDDIHDNIIRQLEYIGENPNREGLIDTPKRVVKSWNELYGGYEMDLDRLVTVFKDGACDELVYLKKIKFYSTCEHHLLPFFGYINIGYIPDKKVIGVSKLARIAEAFSRRLQIQERLTAEIADFLCIKLEPIGVIVTIEAQHFCMTSRGVKQQESLMGTSALRGVFKRDINARQEFLNLIK